MQDTAQHIIYSKSKFQYLKCIEIEAVIWFVGLLMLACSDPYGEEHFTLFLPDLLFGIKSLGYNIGHSIAFFFRFELAHSFEAHPLGIPAVAVLCYRIIKLVRRTITNIKYIRSSHG